jgi:hypothetical protein
VNEFGDKVGLGGRFGFEVIKRGRRAEHGGFDGGRRGRGEFEGFLEVLVVFEVEGFHEFDVATVLGVGVAEVKFEVADVVDVFGLFEGDVDGGFDAVFVGEATDGAAFGVVLWDEAALEGFEFVGDDVAWGYVEGLDGFVGSCFERGADIRDGKSLGRYD